MSDVRVDLSGLDKMIKGLKSPWFVDIGILGAKGSTEQDGITLAGIGAVQEFGSIDGRVPERSFIRMPLETGQKQIEEQVSPTMQKDMAEGNIKHIFQNIGIAGEARIQEAFETGGFGEWAPNAPSTIEKKGSDSPLIDTGNLRKSVTSKVSQ